MTAHATALAVRLVADDATFAPADLVGRQVARLANALTSLPERIAEAPRGGEALTDLAERFCWLHAAACCLLQWWHNRDAAPFGTEPGDAGWLGAALAYLLARADGTDPRREAAALEPALETVVSLLERRLLFSSVPVRLADQTDPISHDQGETWPHPN
ncbi:hypothetical protein [Streptomyces sp. PT12]|uniref:hypothetical protein n=1 Tax=Streptomyces sp. PT12 TaxID=1510197 RepID=UPI00215CF246|nr:hypothetical protein [Streptomyces sp. PT12]